MPDWTATQAIRLTADIGQHPEVATAVKQALGVPLPPVSGALRSGAGIDAIWIGPNDWLILSDHARDLAGKLAAVPNLIATCASLAGFVFAPNTLASATSVRCGMGYAASIRFADIEAVIVRRDGDYELYVDLPLANYVATWAKSVATTPTI